MSSNNVGAPRIIVLMGPSGCGKSSVGRYLATQRAASFIDADEHHSREAIEKMSRGVGLSDEDRLPWLQRLAVLIHDPMVHVDIVLACSALKSSYRQILAAGPRPVSFIYLHVAFAELERRLETRSAHFAGTNLLRSQLECLEMPSSDETIDGGAPFLQVCAAVELKLRAPSTLAPTPQSQEA